MPELPEVETVVRGLRTVLPGRTIVAVEGVAPAVLTGKRIDAVRRYGKFIVIDCLGGMLFVHLGMTGQLLLSEISGKFTRARIFLDEGVLRYDDIRKFGKIFWSTDYPKRGPDPLTLTPQDFATMARLRKTRIKALLLDQSFISGMGNIYTDEALFAAGIHPATPASSLTRPRLLRLHQAMRDILESAIAAGGSSISDYVDSRGEKGSFQSQHLVYSRHGQPCPVCAVELQRMLVSQRGTTFCPRCQKH
jgi:formamidopyrimidine-DNA glycosylase